MARFWRRANGVGRIGAKVKKENGINENQGERGIPMDAKEDIKQWSFCSEKENIEQRRKLSRGLEERSLDIYPPEQAG